jgi:hypothetical protein
MLRLSRRRRSGRPLRCDGKANAIVPASRGFRAKEVRLLTTSAATVASHETDVNDRRVVKRAPVGLTRPSRLTQVMTPTTVARPSACLGIRRLLRAPPLASGSQAASPEKVVADAVVAVVRDCLLDRLS